MRRLAITVIGMTAVLGLWGVVAHGQGGQAGGAAAPAAAPAPPPAPKDKAGYWPNADIQAIWKDLEARQVINQRVADGGAFSINIRIVKEGDAPLVHASSADVWVMQAGTATSITGGPKQSGANISGWTAEFFLPYHLLQPLDNVPPKPGTNWRANFYRMDHDGGRATAWSWVPVGRSFHEIQKFGTLNFE